MNRSSFLGGPAEEVVKYDWPITGLGQCQIGFGICRSSGLVMQTSVIPQEKMLEYYTQIATYVNPNHAGKPMPGKVRDLDRLLQTINFATNKHPDSVLQFGSSDGYTLSRFLEAGSSRVLGVEPGLEAREYARKTYGVASQPGTAENYQVDGRYDLIVLTHILEHLYDPLDLLRRIQSHLKSRGYLLIEIPLWERLDKQPIGVLSFEHVNYFSEDALFTMLHDAGFAPIFSSKLFNVNLYPVITVIAKVSNVKYETRNSYLESRVLLEEYLKKEKDLWQVAENAILNKLHPDVGTYIYGGGIHTSQMLTNTSLRANVDLSGVIDSSPTKWGKEIAGLVIHPPEVLDTLPPKTNVIISSAASEIYILKAITKRRPDLSPLTIYK